MTIKEFAIKYQIPYSVVYQASYDVKKINEYDCSYHEKELFDAVNSIIAKRIKKATEQLKNFLAMKHNLAERSLRSGR